VQATGDAAVGNSSSLFVARVGGKPF